MDATDGAGGRIESALRFLVEAGELLASSLDYEATLEAVAQLLVPRMADWCVIDIMTESGELQRVATAHVDPHKRHLALELERRFPPDKAASAGPRHVARTGQPEWVPEIPEEMLRAAARTAEHRELIRELGLRSYICVPMTARNRVVGVLSLVQAESGRTYTAADLELAKELARRAAFAVDNAQLYRAAQEELTERRRAENALSAGETRLLGIISSAMDAIITIDEDQKVQVFNHAAERMFGWSAEDAVGQPIDNFIPKRFRQAHHHHVESFGQTGVTSRTMTSLQPLAGLRSSGEEFPIEATISQVEAGGQKLYTVIVRDITERRRAESDIQALNQRLTRAMAETHHRVKNNLQVISALVDMQVLQHGDAVDKRHLERIAQHIRALAAIHALLTQQAKTDAELELISVRATLEKLVPTLQAMLADRRISVRADETYLPVRLSTTLAVLINELVSNAVKHGSGDIHLELESKGNSVILVVEDHGSGFPEGFDAVGRESTGLELVKSLIDLDLQGTIRFGRTAQGGARVEIAFPAPTAL